MPVTALYDEDYYAWTKRQADLLRELSLRRGLPNDLDLPRIAEEIEDMGSEKLNAVTSLLTQILVHLLKIAARPDDTPPGAHWRDEVLILHVQVSDRFQPSMRQHIDAERLWRRALKIAQQSLANYGQTLPATPEACPFDILALAADDFDVESYVAALRATMAGN